MKNRGFSDPESNAPPNSNSSGVPGFTWETSFAALATNARIATIMATTPAGNIQVADGVPGVGTGLFSPVSAFAAPVFFSWPVISLFPVATSFQYTRAIKNTAPPEEHTTRLNLNRPLVTSPFNLPASAGHFAFRFASLGRARFSGVGVGGTASGSGVSRCPDPLCHAFQNVDRGLGRPGTRKPVPRL